jgi:hypothetical protein
MGTRAGKLRPSCLASWLAAGCACRFYGVKLNLVAANPGLYVKGGELTWWGFSSTTTDIAALQVHLPSKRATRCFGPVDPLL